MKTLIISFIAVLASAFAVVDANKTSSKVLPSTATISPSTHAVHPKSSIHLVSTTALPSSAHVISSIHHSVHSSSHCSVHPSSHHIVHPSSHHIVHPSSHHSVHPSSHYSVHPSSHHSAHPSSHHKSSAHQSIHRKSSAHPASTHHVSRSSISPSPVTSHITSSSIHTTPKTTYRPTTTPKPVDLNFSVSDNGTKCIYFAGRVTLRVTYKNEAGHTKSTSLELVENGGTANGTCFNKNNSKSVATINIKWTQVSVAISFKQDSKNWYMSEVSVEIIRNNHTIPDFESAKLTASKSYNKSTNGLLIFAGKGHSYKCDSHQTLKLDTKNKNNSIEVDFVKTQMQPFASKKAFSHADTCPAKANPESPSSIVPIAVGCALAGLIVIVLIAYLIGRRRGNRGYQKV